MYTGSELNEIRTQLEGTITVKWRGIVCPKSILSAEHDILLNQYKEQLSNEKYLKDALLNDGLTEEEINNVLNWKYNKDEVKKDELETKKE